nr:sporulation histidine kinase inhibitor Sda [Cytobacillus eiseniae]
MVQLPDELLVETYYKAVNCNLEPCFLQYLLDEIERRGIEVCLAKQVN